MSTTASVPSSRTRNLCIVAHVDHGKSSFADSLLAANGIISARLAGTIRYLDSREDEQERGITMESSAVSLTARAPSLDHLPGTEPTMEDYKINLIDTPGHVDFSSEVSTASRLCDGALVLVDAVEGVCTQTITVLRQIHLSHLRPLLVINKVDRLVTELKLTPTEAYHHLSRIIEDVNAIVGSFYAGERMQDDWRFRERQEAAKQARGGNGDDAEEEEEEYEERDDSQLYFDPTAGTVIFSSAIDGWAFRISRFAQLYAKKLGMSEEKLNKCLWGDWYLDPKEKRVVGRKKMEASGRKGKTLFVQFILENIWAVYENVLINPNPVKVDKIVASLSLRIRPQDLRSKDPRNLLLSIFAQWLPLAASTFRAVIDKIPSPLVAQSIRVPKMLYPDQGLTTDGKVEPKNRLEKDMYGCLEGDDAVRVAYVSKMFAVKKGQLPENQRRPLNAEDMRNRAKLSKETRDRRAQAELDGVEYVDTTPVVDELSEAEKKRLAAEEEADKDREVLIGFARLYSGTIAVNDTLYAVLPKYSDTLAPSVVSNSKHLAPVRVSQLYMMMGRELVAVDRVTAGNLFAINGLEGIVGRNATLCGMGRGADVKSGNERDLDRECLVNLAGVSLTSAPIVRVALEPADPSEMAKLVEGLRMLNQADPCVETMVQETGEHVILTAGELHLERCLKDLRDRFARIEITVSPPIVPFRETAVNGADMAPIKNAGRQRGTIIGSLQNDLLQFTIRAIPLPAPITAFLLANASIIKRLHRAGSGIKAGEDEDESADRDNNGVGVGGEEAVKPEGFWAKLDELCKAQGKEWKNVAEEVWAFGPRRIGANMLIDKTAGATRSLRKRFDRQMFSGPPSGLISPGHPVSANQAAPLDTALLETELATIAAEAASDHEDDSPRILTMPDVRELDENFETAFQLAMNKGPLCAEPVIGMGYFLEEVKINEELDVAVVRSKWSSTRGSLISSGQETFRSGLLDWSPRLLLAMYSCDIQATGEVLGKVYGVVAKRRGRIVSEEMKEGTAFFTITNLLPVVESFGFADEIRTRTSGAASPQLVFYGYELLDQDPFWVPTTLEELEDLGEKSDRDNVAKKYMDAVRIRKGMAVDRKVVEHSEKQKTMRNY